MSIPLGVQLEQTNALQDAADYLYERGSEVYLYDNNESTVDRDKYNSIKKRDPSVKTFHAFPIDYSPTDNQLKKAGIREQVDVIVTLAVQHLTTQSLSYSDIDSIRFEVELDGDMYLIKDKNQINHFSHTYLNVVLGLNKK